jgi:hypothetical protein
MDGNGVYARMYGSGADIRSEEGILR